jgi:hypothetical protein
MTNHLSLDDLSAGLPNIVRSPRDGGALQAIVVRPATDERLSLQECQISPEGGVHGDNWARGCWKSLSDGRPDPDVQVAIMNSRVVDLLAGGRERWALAGDNLFVDLDLSDDNLPTGQRLGIGEAVLEITSHPHNGCKKFAQRYGEDAVKFVNSPPGKQHHLRGIYAKIIRGAVIRVGDEICKL